MSIGTLATKDGKTKIRGTFNYEEDGAISFTPDGAKIAAFFQKREWEFTPDKPKEPNYPLVASQAETADVPLRSVAAPWVGTCPAGHVSPQRFYRKPKRRYSCSACSPRWSEDHILTYTKEAS